MADHLVHQPNNKAQNPLLTQTKACVPKAHSEIHIKAVAASRRYKKSESELIEIFEQIEKHKTYFYYECSSLSQYGVEQLNLSKDVVYNFIQIMRASKKAPALKAELNAGTITLSNAKRIAPVINALNQKEWIKKALTLSSRALEKEIVKIRPKSATREQVSYVTESRMKLELGLFEKDMLDFRHAQDLVSQAAKNAATLEDTLIEMTKFFLMHKDPVRKAKRIMAKKGLNQAPKTQKINQGRKNNTAQINTEINTTCVDSSAANSTVVEGSVPTLALLNQNKSFTKESLTQNTAQLVTRRVHAQNIENADENNALAENQKTKIHFRKRTPIPAHILHQVNLRDQRQCAYQSQKHAQKNDQKHERCKNTRWLEIHHLKPVSEGGENNLENLITLCSAHHRWEHY